MSNFGKIQTLGYKDASETLDEGLKLSAKTGNLPKETDINIRRKEGIIRFTGLGAIDIMGSQIQTEIKPDEPIIPPTNHTGPKKIPYPTYNRRISFYIDHPWFIEAGEELPVHKDTPKMGAIIRSV